MATPESATPPAASGRTSTNVRAAVPRLLVATFPYLSTPARVASSVLAAAVIVATALAWMATLGGAGVTSGLLRPVPLFASLALTGATIASAVLPRYAYAWLESNDWFPDSVGPGVPFAVIGSHLILGCLQIALLNFSSSQPSGAVLAGVSAVGTVLWLVHEALRAYAIHQQATA